jgi:hypothetical protein
LETVVVGPATDLPIPGLYVVCLADYVLYAIVDTPVFGWFSE